jgi:hypothetical protein
VNAPAAGRLSRLLTNNPQKQPPHKRTKGHARRKRA